MYRKPFLKWAGGKYRILDKILPYLPQGARRYVEPFAGSAVVFLNTEYPDSLVCDANRDLINLYRHLQGNGSDFITYCASFFTEENNNEEAYLRMRNKLNSFASSREGAALLLYVNRHCFNGLVRYNSKGMFNTPIGDYKKPYFPFKELCDFQAKLSCINVTFDTADFRATFDRVRSGDVVYCDPPYIPVSKTADFTSYTGKPFTMQDQEDLVNLAKRAAALGARVIISNSDTPSARELYGTNVVTSFVVQRSISCKNRDAVSELIALY